MAGLASIRSTRSSSACAETRMRCPGRRSASEERRRTRSKPLAVQFDVDEGHVRAQPGDATDRLLGRRRHADDPETSGLEQSARRMEEARVVVDGQAAQDHSVRLGPRGPAAIPASCRREPRQGPTNAAIMPVVDGSRGRVVVVDDDVLLREGLVTLLTSAGFEVVERGGDAGQLLRAVREHQPDLVVVDIQMPPTQTTEGLDAARTIRREFPRRPSWSCRLTQRSRRRRSCSPAAGAAATCSRTG